MSARLCPASFGIHFPRAASSHFRENGVAPGRASLMPSPYIGPAVGDRSGQGGRSAMSVPWVAFHGDQRSRRHEYMEAGKGRLQCSWCREITPRAESQAWCFWCDRGPFCFPCCMISHGRAHRCHRGGHAKVFPAGDEEWLLRAKAESADSCGRYGGGKKGGGRKGGYPMVCFRCGEIGHLARDCKGGDRRGKDVRTARGNDGKSRANGAAELEIVDWYCENVTCDAHWKPNWASRHACRTCGQQRFRTQWARCDVVPSRGSEVQTWHAQPVARQRH